MGTHPIFESDFDCLTVESDSRLSEMKRNRDGEHVSYQQTTHQRGWKVLGQSLVIFQLNMRARSLMAFVDLRIKPLKAHLKGIRLNARQLKIFSVKLNDIDCKFNYVDPSSKLVKEDSVKSYEHINECYNQALSIT